MPDEMIGNDELGLADLHEEVAELDAKIAAAAKDDMSDAEKESLNALIEQRNEAFRQHHLQSAAE